MNSKSFVMCNKENGGFLILVAGILVTLVSFAALAFDVGRIFIVRNEMQNAADAAALAGANCLNKQPSPASTMDCIATLSTALNWDSAVGKARTHLASNTAANFPISTTDNGHEIEVGYWNLLTNSPSGGSFSTSFAPLTVNDKPAVRVRIMKQDGMNNGPITMLTRIMFGGTDVPMNAAAIAVISSPATVPQSSLVPQVINKCMYDRFWDSDSGTPRIYTGSPPDPFGLSVIGQPWKVRIGSSYHYDTCQSGQWTSFEQDVNDVPAVRDLINNGNPTPLEIGDDTWIQPGTRASSYNDLDARFPTPPGADVTVVVVDTDDLNSQREAPVVAFAGFRITDVKGGSGKYIEGHFIPSNVVSGSSGIGPFYGTYTPPRLAQ